MKKVNYTLLLLLFSHILYSQVGINTDNPDSSSILELSSNDKGVLIPRVKLQSETDNTTIKNPAKSLLVYNVSTVLTEGFYYNSGTPASPVWKSFNTNSSTMGSEINKMKYLSAKPDETKYVSIGNLSFRFINGADDGSNVFPYRLQMKVSKLINGSNSTTFRINRIDFFDNKSNSQEVNLDIDKSKLGIWYTISSFSGYKGTHSNILHVGADNSTHFYRIYTQEKYGVFWSLVIEGY